MSPFDSVTSQARDLLTLRDGAVADPWLWEHSERVLRLARLLSKAPEAAEDPPDETVVALAALFHDAGWAVQVREGQITRWQILSRPTNELQRELGAGQLQEIAGGVLPDQQVEMAADAIRQCNDRYTSLSAARVLAEATSLDEIGLAYVLRHLRQYQAEGRSVDQLLAGWKRQLEYDFWEARINDCLAFDISRGIARTRLESVRAFMAALERDRGAVDLIDGLRALGVEA